MINDIINDRIKDNLTGACLEVHEYILENYIINNIEELSKHLNKSIPTIQRSIKRLVELGLVERIGSNKTGYWKIKSNK